MQLNNQNIRPKLSQITYGLWRLNDQGMAPLSEVRKRIDLCLELGITTFDHADIYGGYSCEESFGKALKEYPNLRGSMQLVSKCGIKLVHGARPEHKIKHYDTSWQHIIASVENSLRALNTDHLDVLLIHRPDPFMNASETAQALDSLIASGKILHAGISNFAPHHVRMLSAHMKNPLTINQVELHLLNHAPFLDGTLDQCQELGMIPMAWSPLAGGRLTSAELATLNSSLASAMGQVAKETGATSLTQVAIAWLLKHPSGIVPVIGSGNFERIKEMAAARKIDLNREQWFQLWRAATGRDVP